MLDAAELRRKHCSHQTEGLKEPQVNAYLASVPGWALQAGTIAKVYQFKNYYETLAFVNAIAYVIHAEDHHPELVVSYNRCLVKFNTHSVNEGKGGISENDFICAAKIDAVFDRLHG